MTDNAMPWVCTFVVFLRYGIFHSVEKVRIYMSIYNSVLLGSGNLSLEFTTAPGAQMQGSSVNLSGAVVSIVLDENHVYDVTSDCTFSPSSWSSSSSDYTGTITATFSYGTSTLTTSTNVTVQSLQIVTFADGTDAQIKAMIDAHYAGSIDISEHWNVGDTRNISISAISAATGGEAHVAQTMPLVILGFNQDKLATSINGIDRAAVTVKCKYALGSSGSSEAGYIWGSSRTLQNSDVWSNNPRRSWLNSTFYNALPSYVRELIRPVMKRQKTDHTGTGYTDASETIWFPSESEMYGAYNTNSGYTSNVSETLLINGPSGKTNMYSYYNTTTNRTGDDYYNNNGSKGSNRAYAWLMSPAVRYYGDYGYYWCRVNTDSYASSYGGSSPCGVSPGWSF